MSYGVVNATGWQEHHVIPRQIMTDPQFSKAADYVRSANFDIEADINKQWMPSGKVGTYNPDEFSIHRGSHPTFTKDVNRSLEDLYTQADDERWSIQQRQSAIDDFLMVTKAELLDGGPYSIVR